MAEIRVTTMVKAWRTVQAEQTFALWMVRQTAPATWRLAWLLQGVAVLGVKAEPAAVEWGKWDRPEVAPMEARRLLEVQARESAMSLEPFGKALVVVERPLAEVDGMEAGMAIIMGAADLAIRFPRVILLKMCREVPCATQTGFLLSFLAHSLLRPCLR